jgi:hypothetical protein
MEHDHMFESMFGLFYEPRELTAILGEPCERRVRVRTTREGTHGTYTILADQGTPSDAPDDGHNLWRWACGCAGQDFQPESERILLLRTCPDHAALVTFDELASRGRQEGDAPGEHRPPA